MKKRIIAIILTLAMLLSAASVFGICASAADGSDGGTQVDRLISVAKSQVGYYSTGYTKYGAWAGNPYVAWCGAFVSWCAAQAGIPNGVIPKSLSAGAFANVGTYHFSTDISGYVPSAGDLILFKPLANGSRTVYYTAPIVSGKYTVYSHVGIVVSSSAADKTVTIIDGNWGNRVQYRTISLYQNYISAYVTPNYSSGYAGNSITIHGGTNYGYYEVPVPEAVVSSSIYPSGADVEVTWEKLDFANSYKVRVYNCDGERILVKDVKENSFTACGLDDGFYTVTVAAGDGRIISEESEAVSFSVQNIANGIDYRTVVDGTYSLRSAENGYFLGTQYDFKTGNCLIAGELGLPTAAQSFKLSYVSDGKYALYAVTEQGESLVDISSDRRTQNQSYNSGSLFYIVPQNTGAYTLELCSDEGKVLSCDGNTAAATYHTVMTSLYAGEKLQQWYFCDVQGNALDVLDVGEKVIEEVSVEQNDGKLTVSVVTGNSNIPDRVKLCSADRKNVIAYTSEYKMIDGQCVWSLTCDAPAEDTNFVVLYRLSSTNEYSNDSFKVSVEAYDSSNHAVFKNINYKTDENKVTVNVYTPAESEISEVRISLAAFPTLSVASSDESVVSGEYRVWSFTLDAPSESIVLAADYKLVGQETYARDYCSFDIKSYDDMVSDGIIKSVSKSVSNGEITFMVKTASGLSNLSRIMVTKGNDITSPVYTSEYIETDGCLIWTVTLPASGDSTQYIFYPVLGSDYLKSDSYSLIVSESETKSFINNVTYSVSDSKLIFKVVTYKTDEINRVKASLASECGKGIAICSEPVEDGDSYVWTLEINGPLDNTVYCFDVRIASISKYEKNYYICSYENSGSISLLSGIVNDR